MKKKLLVSILFLGLILCVPFTFAKKYADTSLNARFVHWQKMPHVVHIYVFSDDGRPGQPSAQVSKGQPVIFGFEYGGESVEELYEDIIDNEEYVITLAVDGGDPFSVKDGFQEPFIASTRGGPHWSWDHDGDGPGDKDEDGIGDWDGPIVFFRYMVQGLEPGVHTFTFTVTGPFPSISDTITVNVK